MNNKIGRTMWGLGLFTSQLTENAKQWMLYEHVGNRHNACLYFVCLTVNNIKKYSLFVKLSNFGNKDEFNLEGREKNIPA